MPCLAYVPAVLSTGAALVVNLKIGSLLGSAPVLMVFLIPIIKSAYTEGLGPGLKATAWAALLSDYF